MFEIRPAAPEDLGAIENLLALCMVPYGDVRSGKTEFVIAESARGIIGVGGLEKHSEYGLLRSIAVMPGFRKLQIAHRILQRLISTGEESGLNVFYLATHRAQEYFSRQGFKVAPIETVPPEIISSPLMREFYPASATIMVRRQSSIEVELPAAEDSNEIYLDVVRRAKQNFDSGFQCAESVLLATTEVLGIRSPLIPAIATGFCNGTGSNCGTCGALSGGIMTLGIVLGRSHPTESAAITGQAARQLVSQFSTRCGHTQCSQLLACDPNSKEGQFVYNEQHLKHQCREFVAITARIVISLVLEKGVRNLAFQEKS